ncbi:uncharacterized protein LOC130815396 [Amaranthus tricolor]|uniref:uncharacterized protein LOC130815396 n=1 Tax=Amaranthus tricolor TaxID=29722 RepID=UPI002590D14B|nr:uncharacterized protein LOC130815396 [Amaranthus tricolor]
MDLTQESPLKSRSLRSCLSHIGMNMLHLSMSGLNFKLRKMDYPNSNKIGSGVVCGCIFFLFSACLLFLCPRFWVVSQENQEVSNGLPLKFFPVNTKHKTIPVSSDLNMVFDVASIRVPSNVWSLTKDDQ